MDDDDFYIDHYRAKMLFEAMMYAGGFRLECRRERRYSTSPELSPIRKRSISPDYRKGEKELLPYERFQGKQNNYFEIAQKNAEALIKEEEEAKMKAEKKKAKKYRQKLKKLHAQGNNSTSHKINEEHNISNNISDDLGNLNIASASEHICEEGLDINAAFVSEAVKKATNIKIIPDVQKVKKEVKDINVLVKKAQEYENSQHFKEAVQYLSDAISLKPESIDLILKRSFLYFELAKFEKSIRDAQKVLQYSPNNPDAYYRLGEGQFSLSNLTEAKTAFTKLVNNETYCEEAKNRLFSIHIKQLEEMGYNSNEAFAALTKSKNKTLDEAIDFLNELEEGKHADDLYYSDEDESEEDGDFEEDEGNSENNGLSSNSLKTATYKSIEISINNPILTDHENPVGCSSLFVGNLKKDITYKELHDVFIKFGDMKSIRLTTEPNCFAFVNYQEPSAAGQAMGALQGSRWLLSTVPLIVKYPVKIVKSLIPTL